MDSAGVYQQIRQQGIIAIVRGIDIAKIVDVAGALLTGGIGIMEITCNTDLAMEMIKELSSRMEGQMLIGAGTVINKKLCEQAVSAGAKYMIAPDVNPDVIEYCVERDIAVLPGAATATEILTAARHGASMVKIFPAAAIGVEYIKMLRGPIDNIDFVAVGGVRLNSIKDFLAAGCVGIGIGDSVMRKDFVNSCSWQAISDLAQQYVSEIQKYKTLH
jgi:2-dehydro-3-deoxyphosphogluconate aldolase / (4S)-4-hydroxy-2-oxoglutarate aldolase